MKTKSITIETIISGFSHIIWILMLVILVYPINISDLIIMFSGISIGAVAILASIAFGASHFIDQLLNRIFAGIISLFETPLNLNEFYEASKKNKEVARIYYSSWLEKSFFRSMMFSLLMIVVLAICLDLKFNSGKAFWIILIIGGPIEILTFIAFFTQRKEVKKQLDALMGPGNRA